MKSYFKPHHWNAICDVCGFEFKSNALKKRWDGLMACDADYELRNPQDLIRIPKENPAIPWSRPDRDTSTYVVCTLTTSQGIAGIGVAGCMRAGSVNY
jgi:hypothetical protein